MNQARFWILTIPEDEFQPKEKCHALVSYVTGQLESGKDSGYRHWQLMVCFSRKQRLGGVKSIFGSKCHAEPTRSAHARDYCRKEDTAVPGTRFEFGELPIRRNSKPDWQRVWDSAKSGDFESIPANIRVQNYRTIRAIRSDYAKPVGMERTCLVYWGPTGTGKSQLAWEQAGVGAYPKDPSSKFWCGYDGQQHVVIDEFRGQIAIHHLLRWLDRYPVNVELKGSSLPLSALKFWITSNLPVYKWYPDVDQATVDALKRRLEIKEFFS